MQKGLDVIIKLPDIPDAFNVAYLKIVGRSTLPAKIEIFDYNVLQHECQDDTFLLDKSIAPAQRLKSLLNSMSLFLIFIQAIYK